MPIGIGPGATGAIETVFLIDVEQRFETAGGSHLTNAEFGGLDNRGDAAGDVRTLGDFGFVIRHGCANHIPPLPEGTTSDFDLGVH